MSVLGDHPPATECLYTNDNCISEDIEKFKFQAKKFNLPLTEIVAINQYRELRDLSRLLQRVVDNADENANGIDDRLQKIQRILWSQ